METFQIEQAIEVAWDPRADPSLKAQAFTFLEQVRSSVEAWVPAFELALQRQRPSDVVRHTCLDIVGHALVSGLVEESQYSSISDRLLHYFQDVYSYGSGEWASLPPDSTAMQNKLAQTTSQIFKVSYKIQWPSFFRDISALLSLSNGAPDKPSVNGAVLYLKILIALHDDIADVLVPRSAAEQQTCNELKDLIRLRDVQEIAATWHELLRVWKQRGDGLVIDLSLTCIGRWVSWTDISLAVNDVLLATLFECLQASPNNEDISHASRNRQVAIETFGEILSKKMGGEEKLQLIQILKLKDALEFLGQSTDIQQKRYSPDYDTDLAENTAKLVNAVFNDLVKVIETSKEHPVLIEKCFHQFQIFMPHLLRYLSDEYDEVCATVIPGLTDMLSMMRKLAKSNPAVLSTSMTLLPPVLEVVIAKIKYDETADWGSDDTQTDEAEFLDLRKRLHTLQQAVAAVNEGMYIDKVSAVIMQTFQAYNDSSAALTWRDLELALYELHLFGEFAIRNGGLYTKNKPVTSAAESLIGMMHKLMEIVHLQYMELCVRYYTFFEANPGYIGPVLERFVSFIHHDHPKVRLRSWYLLQRLVRYTRLQLGNVAETVIRALSDLLPINAEPVPESNSGENGESLQSDDEQAAHARFSSQLYLYETVGSVSSAAAVPIDTQALLMRSVIQPLCTDISAHLDSAVAGDKTAKLQIHHLIMALGTLARGFSDWTPAHTSPQASPPDLAVVVEFQSASEAILNCLARLKSDFHVREATRFAFSRFVGVLGSSILIELPRWIDGLLTTGSTRDEIALFMRSMDQVIFGFKREIYDILNSLLTPFLQRVFASISEPTHGTDDEIELAELKREYLNFLNVVLNNDLEAVLISKENQPIFIMTVNTVEHLAQDVHDYPTTKLALGVLSRLVMVFGGSDAVSSPSPATGSPLTNGNTTHGPKLEGFEQFMMTRFSPICWAIPRNSAYNTKDAQARLALSEAASLQKTIYLKSGQVYLNYLHDTELSGMGMDAVQMQGYLNALTTMDVRGFQQYFRDLVLTNIG